MTDARPIFGTSGACLHCLVWDIINNHSPNWPDEPSKKMYDAEYIVGCLVEVIAQMIAGQRDRNARRQFVGEVERSLREQIKKALDAGNFPEGKEVKVQ